MNNISIVVINDSDKEKLDKCLKSIADTCSGMNYETIIANIAGIDSYTDEINSALHEVNEDNDVFFISSDCILLPEALTRLRECLNKNDSLGVCSAVSNYSFFMKAFDEAEINSIDDAYRFIEKKHSCDVTFEVKPIVDLAHALFRNEAYKKVFPLDNRIKSEKFQCIDLAMKIMDSDYQSALCWDSYAYCEVCTNRVLRNKKFVEEDEKAIREKRKFNPEYYMNTRYDLVDMIDVPKEKKIDVLEVGAGLGSTLSRIKYEFPNSVVHGIEIVDNVACYGAKNVDMICDNIETYEFRDDEKYDYIIFGDVLEHLVDPYTLVDRLKTNLKQEGCIIASIPNIMNASVMYELLHGFFTYRDAGILDRTHFRFFTQEGVMNLFTERGYEVTAMFGSLGESMSTNNNKEFWDKVFEIDETMNRVQFEPIQFKVCAKKL